MKKVWSMLFLLCFVFTWVLGMAGMVFADEPESNYTVTVGSEAAVSITVGNDADQNKTNPVIYTITLKGDIDRGAANFIVRGYEEAKANHADYVLLKIDTYGGLVDAAMNIKNTIISSSTPTICFVEQKAISAGSLIALSGNVLVMAPGTTMGAAEPRQGDQIADEKVVSMWSKELAGAAEYHHRNGEIAAAMADSRIEIPGVVEKGKLLTLTAGEAVDLNMADFIAEDEAAIFAKMNFSDPQVVSVEPTTKEKMAQFLTSPFVSPVLLTLGIAGIIIELLTVGFGVFGTIGVFSFSLFFAGNLMSGYAGWGAVILFLVGMVLIFLEIFVVPGVGITGLAGILSIVASIVFASPSLEQAAISLLVALVASVILIFLSFKYSRTRSIWNRLILSQKQKNDEGYAAPRRELSNLEGKNGVAITPLRPAGAGLFDGERIDVISEGEFIPAGAMVRVMRVESARVIVREIIPQTEEE
ncbi:MAG: nodulation protein NfeD [Peptococcaceae bacterium]|nr:nodulation protein NfeD [Peptococcaceae bacterium]